MSDSISREVVLDEINRIGVRAFADYSFYSNFFDFVENLPSIDSERKTGYWRLKAEWHGHRYYGCSNCGREISSDELNIHIKYPECPYCNAHMKEKEE